MTVTVEKVKDVLKKKSADIVVKNDHRVYLEVPRSELVHTVNIIASELEAQHISTITARDTGTVFEILYHFFIDGIMITVKTSCPRDDPTVDSIVKIFPGAVLYEREINDILGIEAKGHPDLKRLVLPDNWTGGYPLRKDWKAPEGDQ